MHRSSFEPRYSLRITYRLWWGFVNLDCECASALLVFARLKEGGKFVFDSSQPLNEALRKLDKIP